MSVIATYLGVALTSLSSTASELLPKGNIGIEIELEGGDEDDFPSVDGWELKTDGSLRDGMEYVFDGPQSGDLAIGSILNMGEAMAEFDPRPTFRCSTHIHLDVRDLSWRQWERLVILYVIYEDVFFDHAQDYRRMSNFCVPFINNDYLGQLFGHILRAPEAHKISHVREWPKYSALNLQTTGSFGTVEFRGSHAIWTSEELTDLARRMLHLKRYVLEDNSDNHFAFINKAQEDGLEKVFPTGLREGYTMTDGAMDLGASAAMGALMRSVAPPAPRPSGLDWMAPVQPRAMDPQAELRRSARTVLGRGMSWNHDNLRRLNIQPTHGAPTLGTVLSLMTTLNRMEGVSVRMSDLVTGPSFLRVPMAHKNWMLSNTDFMLTEHHISVTAHTLT